ncbi:MAG: bifunctional diguanylate cyclase/phosphodiesterase [Pseudomonadota bacterium]|nr:bifunctional diguanylate cyclase/phosphodiesterase [Pseudomonadota bacterium]
MAHQKPTPATPLRESENPIAILNALDAVVYDWEIASDRLTHGPNAGRALRGLPEGALRTGAGFAALVTADSDASRYLAVFNGLTADEGGGAPFRVHYNLSDGAGLSLAVEDFGRWFADADGRPSRVHGLLRVLSRVGQAPANVVESEDGVERTLCSRRAFNAWVDERCAEPRPAEATLALMVVGLADLAAVNARHGYDAGDQLIMAAGRRLARSLRGGDKLVRYSGGKFALLVALGANDQPSVAAARIARRVNSEFYPTSAGPLRAQARVGVALSPRHARSAHLLLQRADEALGLAFDTGEATAVFTVNDALAEARRREAWVGDEIVAALNDRRLDIALQPIAPTGSRLPPFDEALVRLHLPDGWVLGADAIVPVAEKLGLIEMVDERVLELAVAHLAVDPERRLSLNVSMASLLSAGWFERLRDRLAGAPGAAARLTIEIVEAQAVAHIAEASRVLKRAKSLGLGVAMDDFGAGHTSFKNLRSLGVDMVKIDGAFVQALASSADDRFFVRTLAAFARHLGILTVAEWVEDAESARLLREWGVDYLQGHYIGPAQTRAADAAPNLASA